MCNCTSEVRIFDAPRNDGVEKSRPAPRLFYRRKLRANIETPDQAVLDPENVTHLLVREQLSAEVAHSLMDLNHGLTVRTRREL
jgi:hypothetical protein